MSTKSYANHIKSDRIKWIIAFLLIAALAVGLVYTMVKVEQKEVTEDVPFYKYGIGTLDEDGFSAKNTGSIYTKYFIPTDDLQMEFVPDAQIAVQIYFYDKYTGMISATEEICANEDLPEEFPENAAYVKLVITPTNDAEITWSEIASIADQFIVTYKK